MQKLRGLNDSSNSDPKNNCRRRDLKEHEKQFIPFIPFKHHQA